MTLSLYAVSIETFVPMLGTLSQLLDKGAAYAAEKKFDPTVLVNARLAPDMFALARQVQIACDQAKGAAARLAGREPPSYEDKEQTIDELKARIAKTIDYVRSIPASAFDGAEDRMITIPFGPDMKAEMNGLQFLRDLTFPNFYFHISTTYDILRHNGVPLGKRDLLAHMAEAIRPRPAA